MNRYALLILQSRQRVTTTELAERLEVSRWTILRDVEALSTAGVPVYAERGRNGGIVLLASARLNASHLGPGEMEALSVAGLNDELLNQMGLAAAHETAARKIAAREAAAPGTRTVIRLAEMVVVDSSAWLAGPGTNVDVAELAWASCSSSATTSRYSSPRSPANASVSSPSILPRGTRHSRRSCDRPATASPCPSTSRFASGRPQPRTRRLLRRHVYAFDQERLGSPTTVLRRIALGAGVRMGGLGSLATTGSWWLLLMHRSVV